MEAGAIQVFPHDLGTLLRVSTPPVNLSIPTSLSNSAITKTQGPIHFEDLDPHRFEDLVRELIYEFEIGKQLRLLTESWPSKQGLSLAEPFPRCRNLTLAEVEATPQLSRFELPHFPADPRAASAHSEPS